MALRITENGIKLLTSSSSDELLVLELVEIIEGDDYDPYSRLVVLSDGTYHVTVNLMETALPGLTAEVPLSPCLIEIHEYVCSRDKSGRTYFVGLATVSLRLTSIHSTFPGTTKFEPTPPVRIQRGLSITYFRNILPSLTLFDMVGESPTFKKLKSFLTRHYAFESLENTDQLDNFPDVSLYHRSLKTYVGDSRKRDIALPESLSRCVSMMRRNVRYDQKNAPSTEMLLSYYSELTAKTGRDCRWRGLTRDNGDNVAYTPYSQIPNHMETVCNSLKNLWNYTADTSDESEKRMVALAAASCFAILDIHPFQDYAESSLMARLMIDWAVGFPFRLPILSEEPIFSDFGFDEAIAQCRSNTTFLVHTTSSCSKCLQTEATVTAGALQPLSAYLLRYFSREIDRFDAMLQKNIEEASSVPGERVTRPKVVVDELLRKSRERMIRDANCFVCFEGSPNISTLCCGKPVHFNCMATWLKEHASCPQCRHELPSLPRSSAASTSPFTHPLGLLDESSDMAATEIGLMERAIQDAFGEAIGSMMAGVTVDEHNTRCRTPSCTRRAARACSNGNCAVCCLSTGVQDCSRHNNFW